MDSLDFIKEIFSKEDLESFEGYLRVELMLDDVLGKYFNSLDDHSDEDLCDLYLKLQDDYESVKYKVTDDLELAYLTVVHKKLSEIILIKMGIRFGQKHGYRYDRQKMETDKTLN